MKKVYELRKAHVELKNKEMIYEGIVVDQCDYESDLIESFESSEEALKKLSTFKSEAWTGASNLVIFQEYYVEEAIYDEDDEWIGGGDILEFSHYNS